MAASGAPVRQLRRGPAPIASFDHDVSDEVRPPVCISHVLPLAALSFVFVSCPRCAVGIPRE